MSEQAVDDDVAVAHRKWLSDGGSERVARAMGDELDSDVHTVCVETDGPPERVVDHCDSRIRRRLIRLGGPPRHLALADAWAGMDALHEFDTVLTSGRECLWWHPTDGQTWVAYIHSPPHRQAHRYPATSGWRRRYARLGAQLSAPNYRRPNKLVANSDVTARRLATHAGIPREEIDVVYPPVDVAGLAPNAGATTAGEDDGYYLSLGRLGEGKRVHEIVTAFRPEWMPDLKVAGSGPERGRVAAAADGGVGIDQYGYVGEATKRALLADARALIHAADGEPFGIVPVEALASGTPLICHDSGFPRILVEGASVGLRFDGDDRAERIGALRDTVQAAEDCGLDYDPAHLRRVAEQFGRERFGAELRTVIDDATTRSGTDLSSAVGAGGEPVPITDGGDGDGD